MLSCLAIAAIILINLNIMNWPLITAWSHLEEPFTKASKTSIADNHAVFLFHGDMVRALVQSYVMAFLI